MRIADNLFPLQDAMIPSRTTWLSTSVRQETNDCIRLLVDF